MLCESKVLQFNVIFSQNNFNKKILYIYINICVCMCMYLCMYVCMYVCKPETIRAIL